MADLELIRVVLLDTIQALNDISMDSTGYRFRKINQSFLSQNNEYAVVAVVNHEYQGISLSQNAFLRQQGYSLYHELGQPVDHQLNHQLTTNYLAYGNQDSPSTNDSLADRYWVNVRGQQRRMGKNGRCFCHLGHATLCQ